MILNILLAIKMLKRTDLNYFFQKMSAFRRDSYKTERVTFFIKR